MGAGKWYDAYDKLGVSIFIADAVTYKILYMNEHLIANLGDKIGQPCYQSLCSRDEPCQGCNPYDPNDPESQTDRIHTRYNPLIGAYVRTSERIIDWDDGTKARLCMSIDITDTVLEQTAQKEKQLRMQEFMLRFSVPFTKPFEFDSLINTSLRELQDYLKTDRACVYCFAEDGKALICTHESQKRPEYGNRIGNRIDTSGIEESVERITHLPYSYEQSTSDIYSLYPAFDYGAKSSCLIPLYDGGVCFGFLLVLTIEEKANWTEYECQLAMMAGNIMAGAFATNRSNQALKEALAEAENASLIKSQFLSNMSHEIRTPMSAIIGLAQIAGATDDLVKLKSCIRSIDASSNQLLSIINDVLDMSKIEAGKLNLQIELFSFERMMANICALMANKVNENGLNLRVEGLDKLSLRYRGDELRISQIITNFLSNAVKFTPAGGNVTVRIRELRRTDSIATLEITVEDTGIGIAEDRLEHVFNVYEQATNKIVHRYGGTGLGLTICKNLAEMMGGSVYVESEINVGSSFTAILPLGLAIDVGTEVYKRLSTDLSKMSALVISKDEYTLARFSTLCERFGLRVDHAVDFGEVNRYIISAFELHDPYTAVFFDFSMNGGEANVNYAQVKHMIKDYELIPILEANDWSRHQNELKQYKFLRHMEKPLFACQIYDTLLEAYNSRVNQSAALDKGSTIDFSGIHMLLAEDIAINRYIVEELLADTCISIDEAEDGVQAVEMFKAAPDKYDIIMMDVQMPNMNGLSATREIRAMGLARSATIPIIALTANAFADDIRDCIDAGMNGHIAKPMAISELLEAIERFCLK